VQDGLDMVGSLTNKRIDKYLVKALLGVGASAEVYEAMDTELNRPAALKVLRHELADDESMRRLFIEEARKAAQLDHSNIVKIYDLGEIFQPKESRSRPYFTMEFMPNGSLKRKLMQDGPWTIRKSLTVLLQICGAVHFAHQKGFIHRDLKSDNILFDQNDTPKVSDFGIARASTGSMPGFTIGAGPIGTPEYMAPEQIGGNAAQVSDLYSLGVIFYEMLAGACPFTGDTTQKIFRHHLSTPIITPIKRLKLHGVRYRVSKQIKRLLERLLEKEAPKRLPNCGELIQLIQQLQFALDHQPKRLVTALVTTAATAAVLYSAIAIAGKMDWKELLGNLFGSKTISCPSKLKGTWKGYSSFVGDTFVYHFIDSISGTEQRGTEDSSVFSSTFKSTRRGPTISFEFPSGKKQAVFTFPDDTSLSLVWFFKKLPDPDDSAAITKNRMTLFRIDSSAPGRITITKISESVKKQKDPDRKDHSKERTTEGPKKPIDYFLIIKTIGSGTVSLDPSAKRYATGTTVTLTAVAGTNYQFNEWKGGLSSSDNPSTITMDDNKTISAHFIIDNSPCPRTFETKWMVWISEGTIAIGDESGIGEFNEQPIVEKKVSSFFIDAKEVSQSQFYAARKFNPSLRKGDNLPVTNISWNEAQEYCECMKKRLPTETEWEYAAKSGAGGGKYPWGNEKSNSMANVGTGALSPVGSHRQGSKGLYDMSGNVAEWTNDAYTPSHDDSAVSDDTKRVIKGGSYGSSLFKNSRSSAREGRMAKKGFDDVGFRCAHD
jgi:serine/threonine-protein kinase PpkA